MGSASTETPEYGAQYIYVEQPYVLRYVSWLIDKQYWFDVQWWPDFKAFRIRFAINIDLRRELPASLRGKFRLIG